MGRAPGAVYLLLAAAVAATAVSAAAFGGAVPLSGWRPARRLLAIMQTFTQPYECQVLPESDVLSALATIDSECPRAPPYICGTAGAPCFDSLAKLGYKCASSVAKAQAMADGKNATQASSRIISLFKACPKALLAVQPAAPAPPARSPSPPPPAVTSPPPAVTSPPPAVTSPPQAPTPSRTSPPIIGNVTAGGNATDGLVWSTWLGRNTSSSASGVCPCPATLTGVALWYEQGLQATSSDESPISGLTVLCSGAGNATTELRLLPGLGDPDSRQTFPTGLATIPLKYGSPMGYLDSILGVGGSGATVVEYTCPAGKQVAGLHVAWEPAPPAASANATAPLNLATGIRIHCRAPGDCAEAGT